MSDGKNERDQKSESEIDRLRFEIQELRAENASLSRRLEARNAQPTGKPPACDEATPKGANSIVVPSMSGITKRATPSEKIALFRNLFRGRDDVYAYRWENRVGKAGYSPSYVRESEKHQVASIGSTASISVRRCDPITDSVIRDHLVGERTIGVYPLVDGDRCWFLAADFDKKTWQKDVTEFFRTCRDYAVPAIIER